MDIEITGNIYFLLKIRYNLTSLKIQKLGFFKDNLLWMLIGLVRDETIGGQSCLLVLSQFQEYWVGSQDQLNESLGIGYQFRWHQLAGPSERRVWKIP